ncbi:histidine-type phosphatase [Porphyromonas pogonae]|uniref:histidine-type phosphatase n=1 Tax=Porphyromonas pogonae TaxID=867595 RepID=UPI002E777645|nr:histidine-type phosphatase [Porphyromonas pogonae]
MKTLRTDYGIKTSCRKIRSTAALWVLLLVAFTSIQAQNPRYNQLHEQYKLKEVVVLSRHNIRAPLSGGNSVLGKVTHGKWTQWTANASELTLKGGVLETMMGQYFRKWLEAEGLFKDGECPGSDEVNVYANSMQRTIATARYFTTAFFPTCDVPVHHRFAPSKMDPVFFPRMTKLSPAIEARATSEINAMGGKGGLKGLTETLKPAFRTIEKVLDMKHAPACETEHICSLDDYDTKLIFKLNEEPNLSGSLKLATRIADALILQYFEVADDKQAAFGHKLSEQEWESISGVKDVYGDILFTAPSVAVNVAHPLLVYMKDELSAPERKLTYLVGHDSNIGSVTKALKVEDYSLPSTIEKKTPIGCKLLLEKWADKQTGKEYVGVSLLYQSTDQLRGLQPLSLNTPPMTYQLRLAGLKANAQGLYELADVNTRFAEAIAEYESLK